MRVTSFSISLLALAAACSQPAGFPHSARRVAVWSVDPAAGVATLAMTYAPDIKVGTARVITTSQELGEAWEYFGFRGDVPKVRWAERQVLVFVEGGLCGARNQAARGGQAVLGAWLTDDGSVIPLFDDPGQVSCPEAASDRVSTGFAYAISIPRVASPPPVRVVLGVHPPPPARAASGEGTLQALADGTPVWVVRHVDGSSSALGVDYEPFPDLLPGFKSSVTFRSRGRRFSGPFDEWGTHVSGVLPGLERYALRVVDGSVQIGASLGRMPAGKAHIEPQTKLAAETRVGEAKPFDAVPHRSVREAVQASGALSVVRAGMRLDANTPPVLCESDATSEKECAPVHGLTVPSGCSGWLQGDFAVRSDGSSLSDLVGLNGNYEYACRTRDGARPWWETGGMWGLAKVSGAATLAGFAGAKGSELEVGAELSGSLRLRYPRARAGFLAGQLGDVFELALRAHWFDGLRQHSDPAWALGLHPWFADGGPWSGWTTPTLLGLAMPELGVINERREYHPYLSWRFPFEYRAHPRRQHPYAASERVAWSFAPSFLLTLGDTPERWRAGIIGGVTLW